MEPALKIKDLHKSYKTTGGEQAALRGLDMTVPRGQVFGFVGPNGAGKSTTIKILIGLVRPNRGTARVMGHAAGSVEARRSLGFLPEVAVYHEFMGAEELLAIHAALAGVPPGQRAERCKHALEVVGLAERRKSRIHEFSKGMKQRLGIAQAIVGDPPLLIMDEVTSGLDPIAQRELKDLILTLRERGITIFFSSHKMSEVETVCDNIAIIHKGRLRAQGTLGELLRLDNRTTIHARGEGLADKLKPLGDLRSVGEAEHFLTLDSARVDGGLDQIRGAGGSILSVVPAQRHLEDVLHQIVQAADREPAA